MFSLLLRKLRNPRNRLHMHLFASFIMRAFMVLLKDWVFVEGIGLAWDVAFAETDAFITERNVKNAIHAIDYRYSLLDILSVAYVSNAYMFPYPFRV